MSKQPILRDHEFEPAYECDICGASYDQHPEPAEKAENARLKAEVSALREALHEAVSSWPSSLSRSRRLIDALLTQLDSAPSSPRPPRDTS